MRKENLLEIHPSEWTSRKDGYKFIPEAATRSDIFYFWLKENAIFTREKSRKSEKFEKWYMWQQCPCHLHGTETL